MAAYEYREKGREIQDVKKIAVTDGKDVMVNSLVQQVSELPFHIHWYILFDILHKCRKGWSIKPAYL